MTAAPRAATRQPDTDEKGPMTLRSVKMGRRGYHCQGFHRTRLCLCWMQSNREVHRAAVRT